MPDSVRVDRRNVQNFGSMQTQATDGTCITKNKNATALNEYNDPQKALGAGISSYH